MVVEGPAVGPSHILVVDDDATVRETFALILATSGYTVEAAQSGAAGLEAFLLHPIDLILLDLRLPDISGVEFLARLHGLDERPRVILVTGFASTSVTVQAMRLGALAVLEKPIYDADLLLSVREAFVQGPPEPLSFSSDACLGPLGRGGCQVDRRPA